MQNEDDLKQAIKKAEFVKAEIEALIFLKKYRQSASSLVFLVDIPSKLSISPASSVRQRYGVSSDAT